MEFPVGILHSLLLPSLLVSLYIYIFGIVIVSIQGYLRNYYCWEINAQGHHNQGCVRISPKNLLVYFTTLLFAVQGHQTDID